MTEANRGREKTNMTISVEGHPVALHFAKEPDVQLALKVKQALLGTYVAAGK